MALSLPDNMVAYHEYTCKDQPPIYVAYVIKKPEKVGSPAYTKGKTKRSLDKKIEDSAFGGPANNY